jgi:hypothetical protein
MVSIRTASASDFEIIYPLFLEVLKNRNISKDNWEKLFKKHWCESEEFFGYVLINNEKAVGFLGTIFSHRLINNRPHKFCNLSTWVVSKEYRMYSIQLLFKVLKLTNVVITAFIPSATTGKIFSGLGFKEIEKELLIIPPTLTFRSIFSSCTLDFNKTTITEYLNSEEKKLLNDHIGFKLIYLLIKSKTGNCLIIGTRKKWKNITFARIHFISNLTVFQSHYSFVCLNVALKFRVLGLIVEGRYLQNCKIGKYFIHRKLSYPMMYKSDVVETGEIDTLYSEFFILNF